MSRPKKVHVLAKKLGPALGRASCGRYVPLLRLIPDENPARWAALRAAGRTCLDCESAGAP